MKKQGKTVLWEIAFITALLAFVLVSFFIFLRDNDRRILEQNDSFIEAATGQTRDRINELVALSQRNVALLAHLYGATMDTPTVDAALLRDMIDRSGFDYVEFIDADGIDLTAEGETADLSDREYYLRGMQGESGKCVVHNSRITHETLFIFYTPFYWRGEIIGVLSGVLRGQLMAERLTVNYFGVQAGSYLLERDGDVLLSAGDGTQTQRDDAKPQNILADLQAGGRLSAQDQAKLEQALAQGTSTNFNYKSSNGAGSAYVTALDDGEWMLLQNFPSRVARGMTAQANSAGIVLEVELTAAFLAFLLYLVIKNRIANRQLVSEKQEMSGIVRQVTQLFDRFSLVDYGTDTYRYLEEKRRGAPETGRYTDLLRQLEGRYLSTSSSGEPMATVLAPDYVRAHLTPDVPYLQFEYQIDMNGPRWENISVLCVRRDAKGEPDRVLYAIQDVTAFKEREMAIRAALQNASQAAEAASQAKTDFLARMSHDIRTPMNAIMGMTAVAAMHLDDPERLTDCLSKITISSRHLLALINDVLDMSKIESGKVVLTEEPFGMADLVESVVTIVRSQTDAKHQQLRVHIADIEHEQVIGDTLRLRQVFVNILGNAVKFTPEGGTITFSIRETASLVHGMACYEFVCEDTGVGMDAEFLKTIFDPFSRAKDSVQKNIEGTGLGMSITRNIVRMMEGDIRVESEPGVGSRFTVQLHLKTQELAAEDTGALADLRVLVADDDRDSCIATCEILDGIGMQAEWVADGDAAVARTLAAHRAQQGFAAVILGWKMPGKDGVATAREIRAQVGDDLPIIILSAYDWSEVEAEARAAGISAFIEKPLFRSRLVYALKTVLGKDTDAPKAPDSAPQRTAHSGKRVLLVEDNELNREIAQELLAHLGVSVEQAEDGQQAVDIVAKAPPHHFDLIFMDIQMPVLNGYDAARRIRALGREDTAHLPIIAMTANAFADDIRAAHDAGMDDHIAKPVETGKLLETLDKWL